jgi:uncharacterized protein YegJ (DUF2314 family)
MSACARAIVLCALLAIAAGAAEAQPPVPSGPAAAAPAAGKKPLIDHGLLPLIEQARAAYPDGRKLFAAGLPRGDRFLVRVQLDDAAGASEYALVRVRTIIGGVIKGSLLSTPKQVAGFQYGQAYDVPEGEILDWIITRADGREEGDFLAKILGKPVP